MITLLSHSRINDKYIPGTYMKNKYTEPVYMYKRYMNPKVNDKEVKKKDHEKQQPQSNEECQNCLQYRPNNK